MNTKCSCCGNNFERGDNEAWKKMCLPCFKLSKRSEPNNDYDELKSRYDHLLTQYSNLQFKHMSLKQYRLPKGLESELKEQLPRLLLICHPDKHNDSQAATKATQWLLSVRERL